MSKNSQPIFIDHILEAITKIKSYIKGKTLTDFMENNELQDAVIRNLEIIGEASRRLPSDLKDKINLPWNEISGMRNKIVHDYFELDIEQVWKTCSDDILEVENLLLPYSNQK